MSDDAAFRVTTGSRRRMQSCAQCGEPLGLYELARSESKPVCSDSECVRRQAQDDEMDAKSK